ncbi:MAG: cellulose biosynthesis cyclic di-GMP-binding regulatory protein BcsB [Chloroflexi bacterium]|nr:cellulose biosynthesis cyclic di-GMP-binding regulatory protein BcsB [Chloroflexota bacterium]
MSSKGSGGASLLNRRFRRLSAGPVGAGLLLGLLYAGVVLPYPGPSAAQETTGMNISFRELQVDDQTLRGFNPTLDVWVTPPGGSLAGDGALNLFFVPSPLLGPPSSMTISLNNAAVWSGSLDNLGGSRQALRVPLPRELLRSDLNRVNFQFLLRLLDDDCRTPDNAARYVTLFRDSYLGFEPEEVETVAADLLQFPLPFLSASSPLTPINVVVPDSPRSEHLTAAAQFAARIGRSAGPTTPNLVLLRSGSATPARMASGHVVLVGTPEEIPWFAQAHEELPVRWLSDPRGAWVSTEGIEVDQDDGLVAIGRSPWNRLRGLLAITGARPEGISKAGAALAAGTVGGVGRGAVAVVPQMPGPRAISSTLGSSLGFTLADLGHRSTTLGGQGTHRFGVTFTAGMPDPSRPATIELLTVHSGIMDVERSSSAVNVNGTSIGSVALDASTASFGRSQLSIPAGLVRPGVNSLSIDFTLHLPQQTECGPLAEERAWVSLLSSTKVSIPQVSGAALDLEAYPYPFVHNRVLNNVALLLPEAEAEQEGALGVAAELGRWAQQDASSLIAGTRGQLADSELARRHLVLFGTLSGSEAVSQAAPRLVGALFDRTRPLERLGLIAIAPSPWQVDRAMLVVSGAGPDLLPAATAALATRNLSGTALFVARDGRPIPVPAAADSEAAESAAPSRPALSPILIASIAVGALTVGALLLGAFRRD